MGCVRIGLAIAERLGHEGAHVVVCSRKQAAVTAAVQALQQQGLAVTGTVCHVGNNDDRKKLIDLVCIVALFFCNPWLCHDMSLHKLGLHEN